MSEIESTQEIQESEQKAEITSLVTYNESEDNQSQQSKLDKSEVIEKDRYPLIQSLNHQIDDLDKLHNNIENQGILEESLRKKSPAKNKNQIDLSTTTTENVTTVPNVENESFSRQTSICLEDIFREVIFLREGMEKLQISVDSLKEEVNCLIQNKSTVSLTKNSVDQRRKQKLESKQTRNKKPDFNAVTYLQEHGEDKLKKELVDKAHTELTQILRSEGIKIAKDSKTLKREEIIQEIILNAKRRLKHGSVFLKD